MIRTSVRGSGVPVSGVSVTGHRSVGPRRPGQCAAVVTAAVLLGAAAPDAGAQDGQDGVYAGVALGWDRAAVDYAKGVPIDVPPATYTRSADGAAGGFGTVRAALGYRAFVAGRTYVAGEFEAALHAARGAAGFLPGTGLGDRDVWPGPWTFDKNHTLGVNARLGYAPGGRLLGAGGSVYLVTGVHWLRAAAGRGFDDGVVSRLNEYDHTLRPWVVGAGLEWGSRANRLGVEVRYSAAELVFHTAGDGSDGSAIGRPRIYHVLRMRDWGVQVGYTRSF